MIALGVKMGYVCMSTDSVNRLHNFIQKDAELRRLNKRHEMCHEDDTMWRRGLNPDGNMPDPVEMVFASNPRDTTGPGMGFRSDRLSDRRVAITSKMRDNNVKRPKGSKKAQEIRYRRELCELTCGV